MLHSQRRRSRFGGALVGLLSLVIVFVVVIQVRSQAEVERTLANEDPATLAFVINDLHGANDALAAEVTRIASQQAALKNSGGSGAHDELANEIKQMELVDGLVPARGPGVIISIDAQLSAIDLEDTVNNLRLSGAEALAINGRRLVSGTPIVEQGGRVLIGGKAASRPWSVVAIGDPQQLASAADLMVRTLQSGGAVTSATWRADPDVTISAVVPQRPFVYGSPG